MEGGGVIKLVHILRLYVFVKEIIQIKVLQTI